MGPRYSQRTHESVNKRDETYVLILSLLMLHNTTVLSPLIMVAGNSEDIRRTLLS
jgi:hypothetical protein